jgi:hypothetical protein
VSDNSGALRQAEQQFGRRVVGCVALGPADVVGCVALGLVDDDQRLHRQGLVHGSVQRVRRAHLTLSCGSSSTWLLPTTSLHSRHCCRNSKVRTRACLSWDGHFNIFLVATTVAKLPSS